MELKHGRGHQNRTFEVWERRLASDRKSDHHLLQNGAPKGPTKGSKIKQKKRLGKRGPTKGQSCFQSGLTPIGFDQGAIRGWSRMASWPLRARRGVGG